jgi:primosomal protein N' (replication factor Y)
MFAEIIPHRRVPSKFATFTYSIPEGEKVHIGQIVTVPFKKQKIIGVVWSIHGNPPSYPTRPIDSISQISLTDQQIGLVKWMHGAYGDASLASIIDLFISEKILELAEGVINIMPPSFALRASEGKHHDISPQLENFVKQLLATKKSCLVIEKTTFPRKAFYDHLSRNLPANSQALFLFPEAFHILESAPQLSTFHGGLKEKEKSAIWNSVYKGDVHAITGTRASLFLPFKNLSLIVLDFEHSESYTELRKPNYRALNVAKKLSELWDIPLVLISSAPKVETYYKVENKLEWEEKENLAPVKIIDIADERRKGRMELLGPTVMESLACTMAKNKQTLLFLNRRGEASAIICRDCGKTFRCETCSSPLTIHKEGLRCHRCGTSKPIPASCDSCGNTKLKQLGGGTESLEKEIRKIFEKAKIIRLDSETISSKKKQKELDLQALTEADIIIATKMIDKPFNLPRLALSIAVLPDALLHFPDFRAAERLMQILTHIRLLNPKNEVMIQTFMPDHKLFKYIEQNKMSDFYEEELSTRKSLKLPPF